MRLQHRNQFKVLRKSLLLPVGTLLILWLIYPGGAILSFLFDAENVDQIATCSLFPPKVVGKIFFCLIIGVVIASLLQLSVNSAIYSMFSGILGGAVIGAWFIFAGLGYAYCWPLPEANSVFSILIPLMFVMSAVIFFLHLRARMPVVLDFNTNKWDFNKMEFSILTPVMRPDGVSNLKFASLLSAAGVTGLLFGKYLTPRGSVQTDWLGVLVLFFVGCFFLGVLAVGEVYLTWLIYKKSKLIGRKMTIMEFSRKPRGN